jgi:hypothetical protein
MDPNCDHPGHPVENTIRIDTPTFIISESTSFNMFQPTDNLQKLFFPCFVCLKNIFDALKPKCCPGQSPSFHGDSAFQQMNPTGHPWLLHKKNQGTSKPEKKHIKKKLIKKTVRWFWMVF